MSRRLKKQISEKLNSYVEKGIAPGFQLCVGLGVDLVEQVEVGLRNSDMKLAVTEETHFDLASLTKVISTATLFLWARQKELIPNFDLKLGSVYPFLKSCLKQKSLREILEHRSGLEAVRKDLPDLPNRQDRLRAFLDQVDTSLENMQESSAEVYSDVGYLILGFALESLFSQNQKLIFEELFADDSELLYGPVQFPLDYLSGFFGLPNLAHCQSLENSSEWLFGEVQDPRSQWLDGVSGHAGLFGTARGVDRWARELFLSYHGKGLRWSDTYTRELIALPPSGAAREKRFFGGFDTPTSTPGQASQAGRNAGSDCIGHLGFTGASFWMDLETGYRVTLLCHRYQTNEAQELWRKERPTFHDWLRDLILA